MPIHKILMIIREAKHHISVAFESSVVPDANIIVRIYSVDIEEESRSHRESAVQQTLGIKPLVGFTSAVAYFRLEGDNMRALADALGEASCPITLTFETLDLWRLDSNALVTLLSNLRHSSTLMFGNVEISDAQMDRVIAAAIKKASCPISLIFENVGLEYGAMQRLADAVKEMRVPVTVNFTETYMGSCLPMIEVLNGAFAPIKIVFDDTNEFDRGTYDNARQDNFAVEARVNPLQFLRRLGFSMISVMLDTVLSFCPQDLTRLIQSYISPADLAWSEVLSIRDVEGASYENKYSSINTTALTSEYFSNDHIGSKRQAVNTGSRLGDFLQAFSVLLSLGSKINSAETLPNWFSGRETLIKFLTLMPSGVTPPMVIPDGFKNVPSDGLCFYHAVARQLDGINGLNLQRRAVNEVLMNYPIYKDFLEDDFWDNNLESLGKDTRGWAGHVMIQAVANMLHRPIEIRRFDLDGTENQDQVLILPRELNHDHQSLMLGNIANLHFVAPDDTQLTGDCGVKDHGLEH